MAFNDQDEAEWAEARGRRSKARLGLCLDIEQIQALAWEAERELATRSLHEFVRQAWPLLEPDVKFVDNWHIRAICAHLEAVGRDEIEQLMINVPPGTMKSLLTCVFWPAWTWAREPGKRFLFSSYAESLSLRDSIKTRLIVQSTWYQARWPLQLVKIQDTRLENDKGGWRIVGSITGKGIGEHPDYNVADDPHNVLNAESEADRLQVTRWFEGVFCVRGEVRNVKRVLVMQRLHASDCAGLALSKGGWTVLCLPMRYEIDHPTASSQARITSLGFFDPRTEDGDLLWPEVYDDHKVTLMENNMGIYTAAGQLQQRPSPREGGTFKRDWFEIVDIIPPRLQRIVRYWDKAGTKDGKGARTAGVLLGEFLRARDDKRMKYVILDVKKGRWAAPEREEVIKHTAEEDAEMYPAHRVETCVEQEPGSGGKESAEFTVINLAGHDVSVDKVSGSKETRAEPLASQASVGNVAIIKAPWNGEFLAEIELFPMGERKDQVDAASGAFNKMHRKKVRVGSLFSA